ncbi:hypothetical protein C5Y93_18485 [Blastopirellula marina]|uniref:Uncharacterized protein n=1 Tax=Blastopirellula marina TaxID=124 RepID=A0A2S8GIY8_9BACT|nr:hypothetical protein C5Y93_18485 [Blastopirellula marina]
MLVVSCLVCAGLTYLGVNHQVTSQLKAQFGDDPIVTQHIGEIQSAWVNVDDSQAIQQQEGRETYIVYDVQGSEADGQLIIQQGTGENLVGDRGFLRVENGDFELTPPPALEEVVEEEIQEPSDP